MKLSIAIILGVIGFFVLYSMNPRLAGAVAILAGIYAIWEVRR